MTPLEAGSTVHEVEIPRLIWHRLCGMGLVADLRELLLPP